MLELDYDSTVRLLLQNTVSFHTTIMTFYTNQKF